MAESWLARAQALVRAGDHAAACAVIDAALAAGSVSRRLRREALLLRARAQEQLNNLRSAIADTRQALALGDPDAPLENALGVLHVDAGDYAAAIAAFARASQIDPQFVRAWNNLGNALDSSGQFEAAERALQRAVALQPGYALGWTNLGLVQRNLGNGMAANASFQRALALDPDLKPPLIALAAFARQEGRIDAAVEFYARALRKSPDDTSVLLQLGGTLAERDDLAGARQAYLRALTARPTLLRAAFGAGLTLPMVPASFDALQAARNRYRTNLAHIGAAVEGMARGRTFADVVDDLRWSNFLLAYQGEDDRELQQQYGTVVARAIDAVAPGERAPLPKAAVAGRRLRVGFASSFFTEGTVGMYFRSWIEDLDRSRFETFIYHLRRGMNPLAAALEQRAEHFHRFEGTAILPSRVAPVIRADALDVLIYPELGMDAATAALAALRLAPVQCAAWGHPVTSGLSTIDVRFTCAAMEPDDAQASYTERLVGLPGIGTRYLPSFPAAGARRSEFGLPESGVLLLCPQSLFKIHPDNDVLFAQVLAAAPGARLVLFAGRHPALTARYLARLGAALSRHGLAVDASVTVLPQCDHPAYLRINAVCDAMLDTLRWSGGNTSLDALACGLPMVTLPGRLMRGRQSAGMLQLMDLNELIAADEAGYVAIAARLAREPDWRQGLRVRILEQRGAVFDDLRPIAALQDALAQLTRA